MTHLICFLFLSFYKLYCFNLKEQHLLYNLQFPVETRVGHTCNVNIVSSDIFYVVLLNLHLQPMNKTQNNKITLMTNSDMSFLMLIFVTNGQSLPSSQMAVIKLKPAMNPIGYIYLCFTNFMLNEYINTSIPQRCKFGTMLVSYPI